MDLPRVIWWLKGPTNACLPQAGDNWSYYRHILKKVANFLLGS
jgi:hypothetical protein